MINGHKNSFRLVIHTFYALLIAGMLFLPPASHGQATGNGIEYHGGPVMNPVTSTVHPSTTVYLIWYGNWSGNSALTILPNFISSLNQSPYFAINTTYGFTPAGSPNPLNITGNITLGTQVFDSYSQGTSLTDTSLRTVVSTAISNGGLLRDPNGVYLVLSSGDVDETGSAGEFCVNFCGFHTHATLGGSDIKYALVGDAYPRCPNSCTAAFFNINTTVSPNGNQGADGMANFIAHELSETVTDPDLNAWYHSNFSGEIGDLCNFNFGPRFTTPNGAQANVTLGGQNYLVQQLWLNDGGGGCTMASTGNPFTFRSAQDELQACNGLAQRASSLCAGISDLNDRQACSAIASNSQTPCQSMTDRNMQLACYGMALAPNFPTNCRDISNPQMQAFCYGASSSNTNSPNCNNVADADSRALCLGMALHDSTQCSSISNQNDRQFCLAVSVANSSNCSSIVTCPDPRGQATCTNSGNVWNTSTCTCSPPPPTCNPNLQQLCISQGGSWDPNTCTCTGGCPGTQITCAQVNPLAQGQASTPLPPTELKSHFPLGIASPAPKSD